MQPSTPRRSTESRDLRAITADGVSFSTMVGLGEAYVPAFVLAVGLGELVAGMIATLPMLAGALFQLVTPRAVRRLRSYRRWVVACAVLQALSFVPLVAGAWAGRIGLVWVCAATVGYWAFGMATGPAWNAWVTSLVPPETRTRFFARRTRAGHAALLAAIMAGGLALEWGRIRDQELALFAVLFAAAIGARLLSASYLARQSEAPGLATRHRTLRPRGVLEAIRSAGSGGVLAYLLLMQVGVNVATPFFTPYMLGPLGLGYAEFMALTAAALLARVLVMPWLGHVAHRHGTRRVLLIGALGIVPLPSLWLVSHAFAYLLALQLCAGVAWAALEFATMLSFFEGIDERDRASVLSGFNLANALAVALGTLVGAALFTRLAGTPEAYAVLFAISTVGRLAAVGILHRATVAREVLEWSFRTLAVRPSLGAVERPILASVSAEPGEPAANGAAGS